MSTINTSPKVETGRPTPAAATLPDDPSPPNLKTRITNTARRGYASFRSFFTSIYGILNIVAIVALIAVLISAGLANTDDARRADTISSSTGVSAYHTRNAALAFAAIGLILLVLDSFLHVTELLKYFPKPFDFIFTIIMLVLSAVYLIIGCCSAAWAKKMSDPPVTNGLGTAAAVITTAFIFIAMIAIIVGFVIRIIRPIRRELD